MKIKILTLGLAIISGSVFAQVSYDNYNKSVFLGFSKMNFTNTENARQTQQKVQQDFPGMNVTVDKLNGNFTDVFGTALQIPGSTLNDKVQTCFNQYMTDFGVHANEWTEVRNTQSPDAAYISFSQTINTHKVVFSWLNFRFSKDGRLTRIQMKNYGTPATNVSPTLTANDAKNAAVQDLSSVTILDNTVDNNWVWFPLPTKTGYELRPAYAFEIKGNGKNLPLDLKGYVDGITGEILHRTNEVKETITDSIKGNVYKQNPLLPATNEPLANLKVTVGSTVYYTDSLGLFSDATLNAPITATVNLQGKWSKVNAALSSNVTPSYQDTILISGSTYIFPTASPSSDRHVNAYYHVNRVHEFMKGFYPTFTGMDISLPTNVDVSGTCNAFYNGNSINFYVAGGGCNSFADCGDIIYHEYGHGISDKFYNAQGAGTINNGALNEGCSDVWGMSISHDPVLGKGSMTNGGIIRRYDLAPKVYPADIVGEVHADGEIIAGAWWDVAVNITSVDTMAQLFTSTYYDVPDGPDGTEGDVYHQVLVSALMHDDNDANLSNGTPHFAQIVAAFAKHGIYLLGDAVLVHTEVPNSPDNVPVTVNATVNVATPAFLQNVVMFYKVRGGTNTVYDSVAMTNTSGSIYTAQIPGQPVGTIVDYYFGIYDYSNSLNASFPQGFTPSGLSSTKTIPYQFGIGLDMKSGTDFENTDPAWTIGNASGDNATAGIWIQATPIGSFLTGATSPIPVQPSMDHTTGTTGKCLVTGNATSTSSAVGTADVDNGKTTVLTPVFDISNFVDPVIEYYRWYSNDAGSNPGQDYWQVMIKDSATSSWITYVDRTLKTDNTWRRRIFKVKDYIPGGTGKIMMKFVAEDANPGSIVEAALDDFYLYDRGIPSSVDNLTNEKAVIYPNPANNEIHVDLKKTSKGSVSIYDLSGKQIADYPFSNASTINIDTKSLAAGSYFLMIKTGKSIQSHKISVIH